MFSDDMDQFRDIFFEESFDLLHQMEDLLIDFDEDSQDTEKLNGIFRCAHSIKGGSGAFGFSKITSFTHILEALLDKMRDGEINACQDVIDLLLKSVDIVSNMLKSEQANETIAEDYGSEIAEKLEAFCGGKIGDAGSADATDANAVDNSDSNVDNSDSNVDNSDSNNAASTADNNAAEAEERPPLHLYNIIFKPFNNLIASGNEPLLLLKELAQYGKISVSANIENVPYIEKIVFDDSYLEWDIELESGESSDEIQSTFDFVIDECDLSIMILAEYSKKEAVVADALSPGEFFDMENYINHNKDSSDAPGINPADYDRRVGAKEAQDNAVAANNSNTSAPAADPSSGKQEGADQEQKPVANTDAAAQPAAKKPEKKPVKTEAAAKKQDSAATSIRVDLNKVDRLVNMTGELVITQAVLEAQSKGLVVDQYRELMKAIEDLSTHTRELQEAVMSVRMQPVRSIFSRMPRLVRDISQKLGKKIQLEMFGENTEIDKTVIEQLGDPLTHMIRNSIDHGIEVPEVRKEKNKDETGTIKLSADHSGGRIIIEIEDDGNGINREVVYNKALEKGIITEENQLSDEEIDNLIFHPGFSTADAVSDISGRGVGMDVVKRNIEGLGGTLSIDNKPGFGSKISVSLPLTLAILDGMIIRIGQEYYILPINNIIETTKPKASDINRIADGNDVMNIRGEFINIVYLYKIFDIHDSIKEAHEGLVILVENGREKFGLLVDELIGQQQVVIKTLKEYAYSVRGISGATILGDGNVSLIVDVAAIGEMRNLYNNANKDVLKDPKGSKENIKEVINE
ncbi:MAG: chemotaxis protein CheA [Pseudomonadota bacterium]